MFAALAAVGVLPFLRPDLWRRDRQRRGVDIADVFVAAVVFVYVLILFG